MLPVVSTRPLSNFELTLSPDGTRVGHHRCSNLLDYTEVKTRYGFLSDATKNPEVIGETAPYQYSTSLRGSSTLRFYRNLNLEACLWEFTSYYDMSELLSDCGGTIGTDGQVSSPALEVWLTFEPVAKTSLVHLPSCFLLGRLGKSWYIVWRSLHFLKGPGVCLAKVASLPVFPFLPLAHMPYRHQHFFFHLGNVFLV